MLDGTRRREVTGRASGIGPVAGMLVPTSSPFKPHPTSVLLVASMRFDQARRKVTVALGNQELTVQEARAVMAAIDLREEGGVKLPGTWSELLEVALGTFESGDEMR